MASFAGVAVLYPKPVDSSKVGVVMVSERVLMLMGQRNVYAKIYASHFETGPLIGVVLRPKVRQNAY